MNVRYMGGTPKSTDIVPQSISVVSETSNDDLKAGENHTKILVELTTLGENATLSDYKRLISEAGNDKALIGTILKIAGEREPLLNGITENTSMMVYAEKLSESMSNPELRSLLLTLASDFSSMSKGTVDALYAFSH